MRFFLRLTILSLSLFVLSCNSGYGFIKFSSKKDTLHTFSAQETIDALNTTIDTIIYQGNKVTREEVLRREMLFSRHDTLNVKKIRQSRSEIFNLLLFNKVNISAKRFVPGDTLSGKAKLKPLIFNAQEQANRLNRSYTAVLVTVYERWYFFPIPTFDLRGTSVTQWIRNPNLSNLNFGLSLQDQNFTGHGDLFTTSFGLGFDPFVGISYSTPYVFGSDKYGLGLAAEYRELKNTAEGHTAFIAPAYNQIRRTIGFSISQRLSAFSLIGVYAEYVALSVSRSVRDRYPFSAISEDGLDQFPTLSLYYRYQRLDYILFPMEGFSFSAKLSKVGIPSANDKLDFTRAALDYRIYKPIFTNLSIAWRTFTVLSSNQPIPNHKRLFLGYSTKIRGYTRTIFNGDHLQLNTVELRAPIIRLNTLRLAFMPIEQFSIFQYGLFMSMFLDSGTIWYNPASKSPPGTSNRFTFSDYKFGYGGGLIFIGGFQWVSRLDFAFNDRGDFEVIFEKAVSF